MSKQISLWKHLCLLLGCCFLSQASWAWDFAEHRKIGDRAMSLVPQLLVDKGLISSTVAVDSLLLQLLNVSHQPNSNQYIMLELSQQPNIVTYGTLCGLAGDHVENPLLLETGLQTHYSKTNRTLALENTAMQNFQTGAKSKELLEINLAYGLMAIKDLSHFYAYGEDMDYHLRKIDPDLVREMQRPSQINAVFDKLNKLPSLSKYFCIHFFAIYLAEEAGREMRNGDTESASDLMFYATMYEAFAEHFLQDSFASGHQMVRRGFTAAAVSNNKALHDFYNTVPLQTANMKGETWSAFGDKRLNQFNMDYKTADDYRQIRVTEKRPYTLPKGDSYERESRVFFQAVQATCESILEVWQGYFETLQGSDRNILNELPDNDKEMPAYVYANYPVIREFPIPFGTDVDDLPLADFTTEEKDALQKIVAEPFSRQFFRSRVANSLMVLFGSTSANSWDGSTTVGARLNISMLNIHVFKKNTGVNMKAGDMAHWLCPTLSGFYAIPYKGSVKSWNVKGGFCYNMDLFLSPKRFLGLYSYYEMGVDQRFGQTRFLVAPAVGIQLGSLLGLHNFNMPGWLRIPLGLILPMKFAISCHKTKGRPVEWVNNMEIDILF